MLRDAEGPVPVWPELLPPELRPGGGPRAHVAMPAPESTGGVGADAGRARVDRPTGPCGDESSERGLSSLVRQVEKGLIGSGGTRGGSKGR